MRTDQPSEKEAFVNSFWGPKDGGLHVVQNRIKDSLTTLQELLDMYSERISIEKEYNKKLERLHTRLRPGSHETGTLKRSLDKMVAENEQMTHYNDKFVLSVQQINYDKLAQFYGVYHKKTSRLEHHMGKLAAKRAEAAKQLQIAKEKHQHDCYQLKTLRLLVQTTLGKELERNEAKLAKVSGSISQSRKNYQVSVANFAELNDIYTRDWSVALLDLYKLEIERIQICKVNCFNFCNNIATLCVDHDGSADAARLVFAQITPPNDLQDFADTYGTGNRIYNPPSFVDFLAGYDDQTELGYSVASYTNPDYVPVLSRSYSTYSAASEAVNSPRRPPIPEKTPKTPSPRKNPMQTVTTPTPALTTTTPKPTEYLSSVPNLKPKTNSIYSSSPEDNKSVFSNKKFGSLNGSSNYSDPSSTSSGRHWASPRRTEKQLSQFQEQINLKTKELPVLKPQEQPRQNVPIMKDFSIDFIAKALEDLNSGGNGDITQYRRSVRAANASTASSPVKSGSPGKTSDATLTSGMVTTAPNTPMPKPRDRQFGAPSDFVDDHNEVATRYDSFQLKPARPRPKSMLDPVTDDSLQTVKQRTHSLKLYTDLHSLVDQLTPVTHQKYVLVATARYTYRPQQHGEMYFRKGWEMFVIHKQEDNWWFCELGRNSGEPGQVGLVPGNYLIE